MTKPTTKTEIEEWLDSLDPSTFPMRDGKHLRAIGKALTDLENAEDALVSAVNAAREAGDSWSMISLVLGTSRQAAHRKYARKDK